MSHLALVSPAVRTTAPPAAQWAHDIRNALTTVGLHLDTLERLAGSAGHKAVEAAHALMLRATAMCEQALAQTARAEPAARRRAVDAVAAIRQVADLIAPIAPEGFAIHVHGDGAFPISADADTCFASFSTCSTTRCRSPAIAAGSGAWISRSSAPTG
jgi:hypothetical protein